MMLHHFVPHTHHVGKSIGHVCTHDHEGGNDLLHLLLECHLQHNHEEIQLKEIHKHTFESQKALPLAIRYNLEYSLHPVCEVDFLYLNNEKLCYSYLFSHNCSLRGPPSLV